jgi:hypothetical protein
MTRLIQIQKGRERAIAVVEEPNVRLVSRFKTVYDLALAAIKNGVSLSVLIRQNLSRKSLKYDPIYHGKSDWHLLMPADHPREPGRCLVSGTGLTHFGSAKNRNAMHQSKAKKDLTDSMRMFQSGVEGGRPERGQIGIAPEWFYKGSGTILRAPGDSLTIPAYADDGGEEAEMVGVYLVDPHGQPWRIGMSPGNEFADHRFEKKNYLNLAGSKIRTCSFGPELLVGAPFKSVPGRARILRHGRVLWSKDICTGEKEMTHSLANLEHHHFKFATHRRPGDLHIHFYGAHSLSFGDQINLVDGDVMEISYRGFGRPLQNPVNVVSRPEKIVTVNALK